jgi:elongation factor G
MIKRQLGSIPLVLHLPIGSESNFMGVIDLIANVAIVWTDTEKNLGAQYTRYPLEGLDAAALEKQSRALPALDSNLRALAASYRTALIEQVVEHDEQVCTTI